LGYVEETGQDYAWFLLVTLLNQNLQGYPEILEKPQKKERDLQSSIFVGSQQDLKKH
jgi:hypothetical protein